MGRRMTPRDISAAKFREESFNSQVNRGEIDPDNYVRTAYVVCGCGVEGCGFISRWLKSHPETVDLKAEHERYNQWLEENRSRE